MIECYRHDSFTESFHTQRRMLITHTAKKGRKRVVPVALKLYICRLPGVLARCAHFTPGWQFALLRRAHRAFSTHHPVKGACLPQTPTNKKYYDRLPDSNIFFWTRMVMNCSRIISWIYFLDHGWNGFDGFRADSLTLCLFVSLTGAKRPPTLCLFWPFWPFWPERSDLRADSLSLCIFVSLSFWPERSDLTATKLSFLNNRKI